MMTQPTNPPMAAIQLTQVNEESYLCKLNAMPSAEVTQQLMAIRDVISQTLADALTDTVIAYNTLLLTFKPQATSEAALKQLVQTAQSPESPTSATLNTNQAVNTRRPVTHEIPVCYDPELAPDLEALAQHAGLDIPTVIDKHTRKTYTVYATGFLPGFAFLGFVDPSIAMPRLATPRRSLAPGSVGIADKQTGIYPASSPAGWRLIGRTPQNLQPTLQPVSGAAAAHDTKPSNQGGTAFTWSPTLQLGDHVQFYAISLAEFRALAAQ